ncbi:TetR/AcrR family transcriptional regulator [Hyphobacterium marinum]|uniref:TetR/AcrR family transcriptional regulator n=1 Tax=Hyphobacterium marinum TaxID=3116574 RepID=A0ABU7LVB0_9PROT|nr:TetR/AcrR family transcriptional regulator [Hyphobacterium sp. Y6023]MEE2565498.1 TetR/AcrR family transcriptional regulator [Hyphobacterium sp. Y6023]
MTRQGVKPAAQDRAKKTRDKLLAAFEALLKEKSFEAMSVADIAGRAGLSVGAVYRRFENKDAFIPAIFDLYRERVEALAASPEGQYVPDLDAGLRVALRGMTAIAWSFLKRDGHLVRAAHLYARLRPDLVGDEWEAMIEAGVASYRQLVDAFADEIARPDPDEAARVLFYLLNTSMIEYGLYREDGPGAALSISDAGFTDAMADAMYGYLTAPEI